MDVFERSLGRYYVKSHSDPKLWYHVKFWWEDDEKVYSCDCADNIMRFDLRECKHIHEVHEYETLNIAK